MQTVDTDKHQLYIDADLVNFEVAVVGDFINEEEEHIVLPWSYMEELIVNRVDEIVEMSGSSLPPVLCLTGKGNFRYDIATVKPYKGNRKDVVKPVHFENVKWFLISRYNTIIIDGMEADDQLSIEQTKGEKTIIASRDKDLLQVPGWHLTWEVGNQPAQPLHFVDEIGELNATYKEGVSAKTGLPTKTFKKLSGTGLLFFYSQILTGDTTDNIPGLPKCGGKKAYDTLHQCKTEACAFKAVKELYTEVYGVEWEPRLIEQARLVWMVRELNEDGSAKMWEIPYDKS